MFKIIFWNRVWKLDLVVLVKRKKFFTLLNEIEMVIKK